MIEIDFDNLINYPCPEVVLDRPTDKSGATVSPHLISINLMQPLKMYSDKCITLESDSYKYYVDQGYTPYAVTFTYPDETTVVSRVIKNGKLKSKYVALEMASQIEQRNKMIKDIYSWANAVNKLLPRGTPIQDGTVYFELTKKGRIHGHGIIFMYNKYVKGVSEIMSIQWVRISKGSMKSMHKVNAKGIQDNAFDKCNNVPAWLNYISKEYNENENL